ncbi:uncharacterized protein BKA78DRAFT_301477 [Phyllosticta capitalensis]|uniref:uncharacterized protein n=1 Tax=Phyllosticta capitalensis TaxID=121624 RepID=UPI003130F70F
MYILCTSAATHVRIVVLPYLRAGLDWLGCGWLKAAYHVGRSPASQVAGTSIG